ncbi:MAG: single-stranded-DNA-specific exonuclease RecJ [Gammaproteobacteria bacterium]|jgi:single-stranded-DNA-specific exonuclease
MEFKIARRALPDNVPPLSGELHPVLERVYRARNVTSLDDLDYKLTRLHQFDLLSGMSAAVELLEHALLQQQRVLIIGDFDADGATSSALAVRALRQFGFKHVDYLVPNRFEFGYGLTPEIVTVAADFNPQLIVTVDNGISSVDGVNAAHQRGIKVLVTDHHLPGAHLPAADATVNPNFPGDVFPSKSLAGVGTIFYVMLALRTHLRESNYFAKHNIAEPNLAELLDLVALGTVADVVSLDKNNRIMVAQGLARIRAGKCCAGIKAIIQVAGRQVERLVATDLAFAVGPRLNAAGRIEDMAIGIECLLCDDPQKALQLAATLDDLNRERKEIEAGMKDQALQIINRMQLDENAELPLGLSLYDPDWHQGVIGIVASRIKDKLHRPVIAFADAGEDAVTGLAVIKGSARSIPGIHIRDVLDTVAATHPQLLKKFGGHAMAAGMSIYQKDFAAFSAVFNEAVDRQLDRKDLYHVVYSDGELQEDDINLELAQQLRQAGPWGQGFAEPLFDGEFEVVDRRVIGERHLKFVLKVPGGKKRVEALAFFVSDISWLQGAEKIRLAYTLDINEYNGLRSVQFIIKHAQAVA